MNKKGDQPRRWMACVYAKQIIEQASSLLLEEAYPNPDLRRAAICAADIEALLKKLRFNLRKPK